MDLSHLSKSEQESIWKVLQRDEKLRKQNDQHVMQLKAELQALKRRGALRGGLDPVYSCARCRVELGRIINRGALCPVCRVKVCKVCRVHGNDAAHWVCIVCHKQMEIQVATGEWMNEFVRRPSRKRDLKAYVPVTHSIKLSITSPRGSAVSCTLEGSPPGRSIGRGRRNPGLTVDQCPTITLAPTPSSSPSLTPSPSPRTKSPLLKQQAIVDEALSRAALPAAFRRSDFSDSGVENPSAGSPKTSQSSDQSWLSTDSGLPMDNRARRCPRLGSSPVTAQATESVSDASDPEMDNGEGLTAGVIFRKVTLKKTKKKRKGAGNPIVVTTAAEQDPLENDFGDSENATATFPSSSPQTPPPLVIPTTNSYQTLPNHWANPAWAFWNQVGSSFSFPRSKETRSLAAGKPSLLQQRHGQCSPGSSPVAHSDSNDSLWWDHGSSPPTPARARKASKGGARVSGNGSGCWWSRSASWDDLSTEDQNQNPEDLLSTVADKIVPEGDEYRLVFISSSSSKSSGLDLDDCASRRQTPEARMDSPAAGSSCSEGDDDGGGSGSSGGGGGGDDGQGPSPTFSLEEVEMADHVRELVTRSVSDSSGSTSVGVEAAVTLSDSVSVYVRGDSLRSSGEVSAWDRIAPFGDPERVVLRPNVGADVVTISVDCFSGVGSSGLLVGDVTVDPLERSIIKVDDDFDDLHYLFLEAEDVPPKEAPKEPPPPIPTQIDDDDDDDDDDYDYYANVEDSRAKSAKGTSLNSPTDSEVVSIVEVQDSVNFVLIGADLAEIDQDPGMAPESVIVEPFAGREEEHVTVHCEDCEEVSSGIEDGAEDEIETELNTSQGDDPVVSAEEEPESKDDEAAMYVEEIEEGTLTISDDGQADVCQIDDETTENAPEDASKTETEVDELVESQEGLLDDRDADCNQEDDIINEFLPEEGEEMQEDAGTDPCQEDVDNDVTEQGRSFEDDSNLGAIEEELIDQEKCVGEEKPQEGSLSEHGHEKVDDEAIEQEGLPEEDTILEDPDTEAILELIEVEQSENATESESGAEIHAEDKHEQQSLLEEELLSGPEVESAQDNVLEENVEKNDFQESGSDSSLDEELEDDLAKDEDEDENIGNVLASTALSGYEKLQLLIAESRALSEASRQKSSGIGAESTTSTLSTGNTSVLERYYTTTLEQRGPQGMRLASPTSPRRQVSPAPVRKEEEYLPEDDASWDDSSSSTSSYSSSSSSSSEDDYNDGDIARTVPVAVRNLDRSLHTILEESCEESESEQKSWPLPRGQQKSVDSADPSQLERYFQMAFGGERKRASWDGSETSDTTSETSSSIFSDLCEPEDEDEDEDDAVALASSRLEKYFLGFSGCPHPGMSSPVDEEGCATPRPDPSDDEGLTAFEKNDGCDTIKRAKKQQRGFSSDEEDPAQGTGPNLPKMGSVAAAADTDKGTAASEDNSGPSADGHGNQQQQSQDGCCCEEPSFVAASALSLDVTASGPMQRAGEEDGNLGEAFPDAKVSLEPLAEETPAGVVVVEENEEEEDVNRAVTVIGSFVGRALTMDRKQQSRDSGFIGSSDDLLREESSPSSGSSSIGSETFPDTKEDRKVCVNAEEETRYIVTQLMSQMTKSMLRSPQLARAKPPEILAFENELTKLMQTVPGIDDTVKEIIEELSSTDYCSDSYESSDYTSSDPEGLFTPTPSSRHSRRLSAAVSGLAASPLPSPTPSNRSLGKEPLSEDTMYIYQRFMMSLAKMAEHVSEEENVADSGAMQEKGSPPPAVKAVQHVRDRLTFLMREVQGESAYPSRRNLRRRPGSDAASLCSTNSTASSSATAAGVDGDSEGSPTDTETSMDSDDEKPTVASPVGTTTVDGMELERWNSDATIVEHVSQTPSRAESVGGSAGSVFCPSSPIGCRSRRASETRCRSGAGSRASRSSAAGRGGTLSASVDALEKPAQGKTEHRRPRSLLSSRGKAGSAFCLSAASQEWKPHFGSCWQLRTACESPRQGGSLQQIWTEHPTDMCRSTPEDLPAQQTPAPQHPVPIQQQRIYQRSAAARSAAGSRSSQQQQQPANRYNQHHHHQGAPLPQLGCRLGQSASHGSLCPKASTLPRGANDLHANVSFLHNSVSGLLTASNTNLAPPAFAAPRQVPQQANRLSVDTADVDGPACRREIRSWPDKACSQSVDSVNTATVTPPQPSFRHIQRTSMSMSKGLGGGSSQELHVPSSFRDNSDDSPGCLRVNVGSGSAAGSSDREEEDIDRLVALHISRGSVSSLAVRSESMSSVYSAAGGGHYGAIAVRGEVQFGLSYNYMTGTLGVLVKQCRDLAAVNAKHNRSDPYVKVYLLPDKSKGGKRKTRVKRHSLNPTFDELLKYPVTISELETRTLWLTVWHSDMFGRNEFLGEVTLPMGYVAFDDPLPKWYPLQERLGPPDEVFSYKGDLVIALKFVPPDVTNQKKGKCSRGALHVLVKEAHNLTATRSNGTSDPFCKSYLLPDKGKNSKQKTTVVKRNCSPKWNHTFVYGDVTAKELSERCLELTLWDYDRITSNDFLGSVRLSLGGGKYQGKDVEWMDSQGDEITVWQEMLDRPNCWVDATVLLRPNMDPRQF